MRSSWTRFKSPAADNLTNHLKKPYDSYEIRNPLEK